MFFLKNSNFFYDQTASIPATHLGAPDRRYAWGRLNGWTIQDGLYLLVPCSVIEYKNAIILPYIIDYLKPKSKSAHNFARNTGPAEHCVRGADDQSAD